MNFDFRRVPLSRAGAYLSISHVLRGMDGVFIRVIHGNNWGRPIFKIELVSGGASIPFREIADPASLRLECAEGWVEFCFQSSRVVRFRGQGATLRITAVSPNTTSFYRGPEQSWVVNESGAGHQYLLQPLTGTFNLTELVRNQPMIDFMSAAVGESFEGMLQEFPSACVPADCSASFEDVRIDVRNDFANWLKTMPAVPANYAAARETAAYILWSCMVDPVGRWTRPCMLMSKNWMTNLWSWDNCFNAMALTYQQPKLAWDQYMILADTQHEQGQFVDYLNDVYGSLSFCKPPIHGWSLRWMMQRTKFITRKQIAEVYEPLCRWTDWWMTYRDFDKDGVPQYHHGNDSGWDNATCFDIGYPVEGPDLSAYLVLQMDVLADLARRLGKNRQAAEWKRRSGELLGRMIKHFWRNDRFVACTNGDHRPSTGDSLLTYLPIVLGKRLPPKIRKSLVAALSDTKRFLTPYGLATESIASKEYNSDGYWRGPIWAPSTLLAVDGLWQVGEKKFAREVARRFCDMCIQSGFAENYDALTGEGRRDPAYTWTSSVFLILAHEYL